MLALQSLRVFLASKGAVRHRPVLLGCGQVWVGGRARRRIGGPSARPHATLRKCRKIHVVQSYI